MDAVALAARELADRLLLLRALEVEPSDVAARGRLVVPNLEDIEAAGDLLPYRLPVIERMARLVHIGQPHCRSDADLAGVRILTAGQHPKQRRLAGSVRTDDAHDPAAREREGKTIDEETVAITLAQSLDLDHELSEALAGRDVDLVGLVTLLKFPRGQLLVALQAGLALGLTGLGILPHPLELVLEGLAQRLALALL